MGVDRFGTLLYGIGEAAGDPAVPPSTLTTWAYGYQRRRAGGRDASAPPVVTAVRPERPGDPAVPFIGLAEAYALAAFRHAGVPMQRIRPAIDVLARELGLQHALASRRLYTDGAEVLYDYARHAGDTPEGDSARELGRGRDPCRNPSTRLGWIEEAAKRGWPILMKDKRIRHRQAEIAAVAEHKARCFVITRGDLPSAHMVQRFIDNTTAIRVAVAQPGPYIYSVQTDRISRLYP